MHALKTSSKYVDPHIYQLDMYLVNIKYDTHAPFNETEVIAENPESEQGIFE